jgi:hypothetical protein
MLLTIGVDNRPGNPGLNNCPLLFPEILISITERQNTVFVGRTESSSRKPTKNSVFCGMRPHPYTTTFDLFAGGVRFETLPEK